MNRANFGSGQIKRRESNMSVRRIHVAIFVPVFVIAALAVMFHVEHWQLACNEARKNKQKSFQLF